MSYVVAFEYLCIKIFIRIKYAMQVSSVINLHSLREGENDQILQTTEPRNIVRFYQKFEVDEGRRSSIKSVRQSVGFSQPSSLIQNLLFQVSSSFSILQ